MNSQLHPVFQQALAPFVQPVCHNSPPPCPKGMTSYDWSHDGFTVACFLDYEEGCRGSFEDGMQMEPDEPASMTLCHAYVRDLDIFCLLSDEQIAEVETLALQGSDDGDYDGPDSYDYDYEDDAS